MDDERIITNEVWQVYKLYRSEYLRNWLVDRYRDYVVRIARRLKRSLYEQVDLDDLASEGYIGLIQAVESYDPDSGVTFENYAYMRIRGAMMDYLRERDWVPRLTRQRERMLNNATLALQVRLCRQPTDVEIAKELGLVNAVYKRFKRDAAAIGCHSLDCCLGETDGGRDIIGYHLEPHRSSPDPSSKITRKDLMEFLMKGMSREQRLVLVLYYFERMTMSEIGQAIGLSQSRISQIHTRLIACFNARLSGREKKII